MSSRGTQRERAIKHILQDQDWWVARAAGSLGDADLVALKAGHRPRLIEIKATHRGPFHSFGPKDRADILFAAELAGADAWLVHWPPRGKPVWYPSEEWPKERKTRVAPPTPVRQTENSSAPSPATRTTHRPAAHQAADN